MTLRFLALPPIVVAALVASPARARAAPDPVLAAYDRAEGAIPFAGETLDLDDALVRLAYERDPDARRSLFGAMAMAGESVAGAPGAPSPYAGLVSAAASGARGADPFAATAQAWGMTGDELEGRLVRLLEAWRGTLPDGQVEPWDWYFAAGDAARVLAPALSRDRVIAAAVRWCDDLGAPLDELDVRLDLDPGPGTPERPVVRVVRAPRFKNGTYGAGRYRVEASIDVGGLDTLDALLQALGRAIHVAAIRAPRPEDCAPPDDPAFAAALAGMIGDTAYDPGWLDRYLGATAPAGDGRRALLSKTMLAACRALFERRMFADPAADPSVEWSGLTQRYLGIVPHPELAWWTFSRDLVARPGSAVQTAWGAVVAADLRHRVLALRGPNAFDAPEPGLYVWLLPRLYGFGRAYDGPAIAERFLGRPASIEPLLATISSPTPPE